MARDDILEELFDRIRDRVGEIRDEVRQEVRDRILSVAMEEPLVAEATARKSDRARAPKGTVPRLCDRTLVAIYPQGLTVNRIVDSAQDECERLVDQSSVRSHLRRFEKEGRYEERAGVWYLGPNHEERKDGPQDAKRDDLLGSTANVLKLGGA